MAYPVSGTPYLGSSASPAYTGIFIPTIWSGKFVEKFYDATVLGAIATTDYEGEIRNFGDTVNIRTHPTIQISPYQTDQALNVQRPSAPLVTLQINQGAYFNTVLDDVMQIQADVDLLSNWADNASEQMKVYVDGVLLAVPMIGNLVSGATTLVVTPGGSQNLGYPAGRLSASINLGASANSTIFVGGAKYYGAPLFLGKATGLTAGGSTAFYGVPDFLGSGLTKTNAKAILDFIIDSGLVLDEQRVPESGRWIVLPAWAAAMVKRSAFQQAYLTGDAVSIARNGRLGMIDRFTVYVSNLLPIGVGTSAAVTASTVGGATSAAAAGLAASLAVGEYACYFGHSLGLTFASQMTKVETLRSESTFGTLMRGLQVWGFQVINPTLIGYAVLSNSGL